LSIGFELLPFGDSFLTFSRQQLTDKGDGKPIEMEKINEKEYRDLQYARNGAWLRQDDFTVALVSHLSNNALRGRQPITDVYPHLLDQAYFYQTRLPKDIMPTADVKISIDVENYWDVRSNEFFSREKVNAEGSKKQYKLAPCKDQPEPGNKRIGVRVKFSGGGKIQFSARQIRLVAKNAKNGEVSESRAVGIGDDKAGGKLVQTWDAEVYVREVGAKIHYVDFVFEVPDAVEFDPDGSFIEFKQNARAEISPAKDMGKKRPKAAPKPKSDQDGGEGGEGGQSPDAGASTEGPGHKRPSGPSSSRDESHGRVSGIGPAREALVSDQLPFDAPLTEYGGNPEAPGGAIRGGYLVATLTDDWKPPQGSQPPVDRIQVSSDLRLVQVSVEKLQPGSFLGRAKGFAVDKLADFYLLDSKGGQHLPVGMYGMAKVGGKATFELRLLDESARSGEDVMAKLPAFDRIKRQNFTGEYALYFIYQVKPGTKITAIHTDGRNSIPLDKFDLDTK
jgi:hypothetical protein